MSAFATKENKGLLWNTLNESGYFNGIENSDYNVVKQNFEQLISQTNVSSKQNILDINKQFIAYFSNYLTQFKNKKLTPNTSLQQVYSADARRKASTDQFNYALQSRQSERNDNEPKKPTNLDFSDTSSGDRPIKDMDAQLAKMMADRQLDLAVDDKDINKAEKWINNGQKKSVTFSNEKIEPVSNNSDFLSKLKTVDNVPTIPIPSISDNSISEFSSSQDLSQSDKSVIIQKISIIQTEIDNIKELLKK